MKTTRYIPTLAAVASCLLGDAFATDRFFDDVSAESPSKRYKVEAKSPDNANPKSDKAFQSSFVYTCRDTATEQVLWTRKQGEEASPTVVFVSDAGWTVIWTGWDEIIAVDLAGHDRCRIGLLKECFTKEEKKKYVHDTTAGPMWSGYSLSYFLNTGEQPLFVVRSWWGRRVVLDLRSGKVIDETRDVSNAAMACEREFVMNKLARGVEMCKQWEKMDYDEEFWPIQKASYLAGRLSVPEAIPLLEQLQDIPFSGNSTSGGLGTGERFEGEVNPHSYETFTLRQVVQLSLRRLGKVPRPLDANQFEVQFGDHKKDHPYVPKVATVPRAANAGNIKTGMKAEQVLDLLGAPDFVGYDTWEYDMDADPPFSLILKWDVRSVTEVRKKTPPLWKEGFVRDEQIVN